MDKTILSWRWIRKNQQTLQIWIPHDFNSYSETSRFKKEEKKRVAREGKIFVQFYMTATHTITEIKHGINVSTTISAQNDS